MDERRFRRILRSALALSLATPAVIVVACTDALAPTAGEPHADLKGGVSDAAAAPLDCDAATLYGSPAGEWPGGPFQNREWEAGSYDASIPGRRPACGCAALPSDIACIVHRQFPCGEAAEDQALPIATCRAHCPPTDGAGRPLQSCKGERDGVFDASNYTGDFTKGGAPALKCNYIAPDACGCGVDDKVPLPEPCTDALRVFPCGEPSPTVVDASYQGPLYDDAVCAKHCSWAYGDASGHTQCGPGRDENGALMIKCYATGCFGRRPEGLADVSPACGEPIGAYFADACRMEAASVHAFAALREELRMHGAPAELVGRAERAQEDEVRHARMTAKLARRFGAEEGAWAEPPQVTSLGQRSLEAVALENAIEGCVNETYAALLAMWQGENARDGRVREAMRAIAEDETRHASLACSVAQWIEPLLDDEARSRVDEALAHAVRELARSSSLPPSGDLVVARLAPTAEQQAALVRALVSTLAVTRPRRALAAAAPT